MNELIEKRRSTISFSPQPVEESKVKLIFEAARWAASSFNEQPWRFLYATQNDKASFDKLASCLYDGNLTWAGKAPVLILTITKKSFSANGKPNRHSWHDVGLAVGNLSIQATELGLSLHQMAGFDAKMAQEIYQIPEDYEPVSMIALGYREDIDKLDEKLQAREKSPRSRKPLQEIVFNSKLPDSMI